MRKVAAFVANPIRSPYKHDQYDSFKSEGRIPINMGFGLALLGFEINIIFNEWKVDNNVQVWNNVYLSNSPKYNHYDYLLTWSLDSLYNINFDKAIFMDWSFMYENGVAQFVNTKKKDVIYTIVSKHMIDYRQRIVNIKGPIDVSYLPPLYPIPSTNIGFIPFKFAPANYELKIYVYYNPRRFAEDFTPKEQLIINFFRSKGYKIKLYIHTVSRDMICPLDADNIIYFYDSDARYIDIINIIGSADISITIGSHMTAVSIQDTLSLGIPMIYISNDTITFGKDICVNYLYEYPTYLLYTKENDEESIKKLEKFISNPKESYDKFKEAFKDCDFNNWKEYAKKFFIP